VQHVSKIDVFRLQEKRRFLSLNSNQIISKKRMLIRVSHFAMSACEGLRVMFFSVFFSLYRHGAVRAAANLCDMSGPIQKSKAPAMPAQLLHGAVHGRPRRLRASTGQVSRMPCRTSYTVSSESPLSSIDPLIHPDATILNFRIINDDLRPKR